MDFNMIYKGSDSFLPFQIKIWIEAYEYNNEDISLRYALTQL